MKFRCGREVVVAALLAVSVGPCWAGAPPAAASSVIGPKAAKVHAVGEHFTQVFHDAEGHVIDATTFMQRARSGQRFRMAKDTGRKVTTFTLYPPGDHPVGANDMSTAGARPKLHPGQQLPAFRLPTVSGQTVNQATLRGRPTLVNFFFAECSPCIAEIPTLDAYAKQHPDMRVLAMTFDDQATARAFVAKRHFGWPVVYAAKDLVDRIGIKEYPTMAVFDANGKLRAIGTSASIAPGADAPTPAQIDRWVRAALASQRVKAGHAPG